MAFFIQVWVGIHPEVKHNFSDCDRTVQLQGFWICWSHQGVLSGLKYNTMWRWYDLLLTNLMFFSFFHSGASFISGTLVVLQLELSLLALGKRYWALPFPHSWFGSSGGFWSNHFHFDRRQTTAFFLCTVPRA